MAFANQLMNPRLLRGLRCIIFDCDGVLVDSFEANMRYYGMIKERLGLPPLTDEEKTYVHTRTHKDSIRFIAPGDLFRQAWAVVQEFDSSSLFPYLRRSEGIREFLWWLRGAGFRLAVNTSRTDSMGTILRLMDLEGFFYPVITSGKVTTPKPHPEGVHRILAAHRLAPDEVAYIGDSHVDEKTALAAGVRFWAYRDPALQAQVHIDSFWDIKAAMQRCYKGPGLSH
jgi:phosphoglycolate phosphatase-like HAD superfamily hydrolase